MMRVIVLVIATIGVVCAAGAPAAAGAGAAAAAADPEAAGPPATVVLDLKNFDDKVSYYGDDEWLLEFYAPWCGHCQQFSPTYDKIARVLTAVKKNVAKIDCVAAKPICQRFGVNSFPTIKLVRGKFVPPADPRKPKTAEQVAADAAAEGRRVYDYSGERTVEALVAWVQTGYANANSDVFPKPGETLEGAGSISKLILSHPYLSGTVLAVIVLLLLFFIYIMCDSMRDEEEEAKAVAAARAKGKADKAEAVLAAAAAGANGAAAAAAAANGNGHAANGDADAADTTVKPRRSQRAE